MAAKFYMVCRRGILQGWACVLVRHNPTPGSSIHGGIVTPYALNTDLNLKFCYVLLRQYKLTMQAPTMA